MNLDNNLQYGYLKRMHLDRENVYFVIADDSDIFSTLNLLEEKYPGQILSKIPEPIKGIELSVIHISPHLDDFLPKDQLREGYIMKLMAKDGKKDIYYITKGRSDELFVLESIRKKYFDRTFDDLPAYPLFHCSEPFGPLKIWVSPQS